MKTIIVIVCGVLLFGDDARAQTVAHTPREHATTLAVTGGATRSVSVFDLRFFDLSVEQPFRWQDPIEKSEALARSYAEVAFQDGLNVVEICPMVPRGDGSFRHPITLRERLLPSCERFGYVEPEVRFLPTPKPKKKLVQKQKAQKKPVKKKRRGSK